MRQSPLVTALALAITSPVFAQQPPYAALTNRPIKALSAQEVDDLLNGRGMGYALAAELNGFPGPRHVLELADSLHLSPQQHARTRDIFQTMQRAAAGLGRVLVAGEATLDSVFRSSRISTDDLLIVEELAKVAGRLRLTHLNAHLAMMAVLTPEQVRRYRQLRGYTPASDHDPARHH